MSETSRYLYGDSTPFPLEHNFLLLLEEATRACTALLAADRRLTKAQHAIQVAVGRADGDLQELQGLFASVEQSLHAYLPAEDPQTVTEEAAQRLRDGGVSARQQIEQQVIAWRDAAIRKAEDSVGRDRFVLEMSPFLLKTELPETLWQVQWRSMGEETAEAQSFSHSTVGLKAQYQINIPADSVLNKARRLQNWIETLPVHVEREGRWRKTAKRSVERLEKYFVTSLRMDATGHWLTLHKNLKEGAPGFEFFVPLAAEQKATMRLLELDNADATVPVDDEDVPGLKLVIQAMQPQLQALQQHRHRVLKIWYQDQDIASLTRPGLLAEAIIDLLAPLVRELRARSSAPGELNLKVEVQDGRREEIFIKEKFITDIYAVLKKPQYQAFSLFALDEQLDATAVQGPVEDNAQAKVTVKLDKDMPQKSEPDFDYEPMSNPEFRYEPVSDAELDIEALEPLTDPGDDDVLAAQEADSGADPVAAGEAAVEAPVESPEALPEPLPAASPLALPESEPPEKPKSAQPQEAAPAAVVERDPVAAMFNDDEVLSMGTAGVQALDDEDTHK